MKKSMESPSVIICSRNRANQLAACLAKIPKASFETHHVELILVDNASSDETADLMAAHADKAIYPVKCITAPQPGLGIARNLGIEAATRELLVFTDDDCYLSDDYIVQLLDNFDKARYQFCGGRILLWDESDARVSINYHNEFFLIPSGSFLAAGTIQGANMVIHRDIIEKVGAFNPHLGAGTPLRCEDIELLGRATMNGFTGAYLPELVVYHHHQRKLGEKIKQLRKDNDIARGAYYACMSDQGFLNYWFEGMKQALTTAPGFGQNQYDVLVNELRGAEIYFEMKAKGEI
jgi:glycosyltransferase involved in cell wall biosynthesis